MTTLTLTLDDAAARKARRAARRAQASLEDLLCQFVEKLGSSEPDSAVSQGEQAARNMETLFGKFSRPLGGKGYSSRDELYERPPLS